MTRHVRAEKNHWAKKKKKKPVDNQPAHYYKKPVGKKPGTKKKGQNQWTKNQSENHWAETNRLLECETFIRGVFCPNLCVCLCVCLERVAF